MCSDHDHKPQSPGFRIGLRNAITNWNQPLPTSVKLRMLSRNLWIRVSTGSSCCGHDGEPGC